MEKTGYQLIRSSRKTIAIQVRPNGEVVVRVPNRMPLAAIERFVSEKQDWIEKHLPKKAEALPKLTEVELYDLAQQAKQVIPERAAHYAGLLGVAYGTITIRNQRTRWGSCSAKGNLNFNCLLMLAPGRVIDYVVVHELCHRKEMNHSAAFWSEVERILPDYRNCRLWLKEQGQALIGRLN